MDSDALRRYEVLGVTLDDLTFADAVSLLRAALADPAPTTLFFANANTLNLAAASPADRCNLAEADFVFGDGTGVRWAARLGGLRLRANLNGSDLLPALLAAADGDGRSCFLLGAEPNVVAGCAAAISHRYPGWQVAGHHHGFLDDDSGSRVLEAIELARPDLLLVGMGNPRQERWISENAHDLPVRLMAGVGALFAYMSGDYRRAPSFVQRLGVEWLFVLFLQRHKWRRYVFGAPSFLFRVMREHLAGQGQRVSLLVLFHTMDPRGGKLGGIETHVRLMLARFPGEVLFVGLDEIGDLALGQVASLAYEGRALRFLPVARADAGRVNSAAKRLAQSVTLRFLLGSLRHLPAIRRAIGGAPASCEIERFEFAILPRLLGRLCVLMVHNEERRDASMDSLIKRYWWLHRGNERAALELAARVFAVNPSIADRIGGLSRRIARKTQVLSVSVDTARFAPTPFPQGDVLRVCFAGRLDAFKDPPLMLASLAEAARRLGEAPAGRFRRLAFDYVGASDIAAVPGFAAIENFTTRHGPQPAAEVAAIMRGSHAGIITSFFEGMPCYLLEMLASGRPVAAVELPQFKVLLGGGEGEGGGGRLVVRAAAPEHTSAAMAGALLDLAEAIAFGTLDPAKLAALVGPYSVEAQMGRLFDAHETLAQGSESASRA